MKKGNLYIKILEFGNEHPEGFHTNEIKESLKLSEWENKILVTHLVNAYKNRLVGNTQPNIPSLFTCILEGGDFQSGNSKYILDPGSYFNYIDYQELITARKSSEDANKNARVAVYIAIISMIISVIFSCWQILKSTTIDQNQLNKIIQAIYNIKNINI